MKLKETDKGVDIVRSLRRSHQSNAFACVCGEDDPSFTWHSVGQYEIKTEHKY